MAPEGSEIIKSLTVGSDVLDGEPSLPIIAFFAIGVAVAGAGAAA